ncbi:hypothetical protein Pint_13860 [Pistacia integerrima]|uniref:Uncharacterized protein n=1 Tax=Pistacia integerrima TaxID=434235 RepID=A0ACC0Y993_9ROSI|nr:hypothetical protein Pint_13860 [Pistacia integerrima]
MEPKEDKTRIYVGGLGEKVTSDDLMKIFSSLGDVKTVDIVRTKGRSFGYVDFFPSSDKSLPKLFSTYNGCVWKGGRLRLEKAKEHYLARLNREWAEDAQLASTPPTECGDGDKDTASLEKSEKVVDSAKNLHIFFPRLRKVKALPFSGTGKHKYSFQRVEAPPLPMYFCDCEEHFVPSCTAKGKEMQNHTAKEEEMHGLAAESGGVNEEELNIMNSVMKKLFERENVSKSASHETGPADDGHDSIKLIEDLQFSENEEDEDNIVINVVSRGNNKMALSRCQEKSTTLPINQKSTFRETRNSKGRLAQSEPESQKNPKKKKSLFSEESTRDEFVSANPGVDMNLQTPLGAQRAGTKSGVKQSTTDCSWSQKLSWRALVGDKDSSVFNVSNILPVVASTKEADNAVESIEDLQFDENETGEDDLIINVVSKRNNRKKLPGNQEQGAKSTVIQKSTSNEIQTAEDTRVQSVHQAQNKKCSGALQKHTHGSSNPSRAEPTEPESIVKQSILNPSESQKSSCGELVGENDKDEFTVSNMLRDISTKEEQPVSDVPNAPESTDSENKFASKSGRGSSWFQKSPWTQLVTENNNSFSITQIAPGITFKNHELTKPQGVPNTVKKDDNKGSNLVKEDKSESSRGGSTTVNNRKEGGVASNLPEKNQQTVVGNIEASASIVEYNNDSVQKQMPNEDVSIGETCSFMRSAASLKEWAKTKAALSGSHKRKSNENASISGSGMKSSSTSTQKIPRNEIQEADCLPRGGRGSYALVEMNSQYLTPTWSAEVPGKERGIDCSASVIELMHENKPLMGNKLLPAFSWFFHNLSQLLTLLL